MRRTKTLGIAEVINELLCEYKLEGKLKHARIIAAWPEVLRAGLAKPSDELHIKGDVLFVKISSSVIRNELYMMRSTLLERLNEKAGEEVIKNIVFHY